jgi:hypothetical protein
MHNKSVRLVILLVGGLVMLWLLNSLVVPQTVTYLKTRHLKQVFAEQVSLLSSPIASLGVQGSPSTQYQCTGNQGTNHWVTKSICQTFLDYTNSFKTGLAPSYHTNAVNFDTLLQANGWINDSPKNGRVNLTSISSVDTSAYTEMSVPFHKNIGSISCNLDIDFGTLGSPLTASTGSLNVNEFSCSQDIAYPELRLSVQPYSGV